MCKVMIGEPNAKESKSKERKKRWANPTHELQTHIEEVEKIKKKKRIRRVAENIGYMDPPPPRTENFVYCPYYTKKRDVISEIPKALSRDPGRNSSRNEERSVDYSRGGMGEWLGKLFFLHLRDFGSRSAEIIAISHEEDNFQ